MERLKPEGPFKPFQLKPDKRNPLIEFPPDVMNFMDEGNIIEDSSRTRIYFMPFVFVRFGNENCFSVRRMDDFSPEEIGIPHYKRMTQSEWEAYVESFNTGAK